MNKHITYFITLLLLFISNTTVIAQNAQLRAYTIEDGLPQSQVYDMVQDNMGYLWLGTQGGGLANFDGNTFKVWNQSNGLPSNYIHALHYSNDSLFIGTKRGLSIKLKNNFINIGAPQVNQFYKFKKVLYIATKKGIYSFSKNKQLQKTSIHPEIDNHSINTMLFDGVSYWIATNKALWKLSELKASASIKKIETNNFTSLVSYNNTLFAATFNDGILIIDTQNNDDAILMREPLRINSMSMHNDNELWIATDNDGITIINANTNSEITKLNPKNGLAVSHIRKTISDQQSNIWIATSGGGFYKYFQNSFKHYDRSTGLKGNRVYALHKANNGIWVSSAKGYLAQIDSLGIHRLPKINAFTNVKTRTITSDKRGNIWAGSDGNGLLFRETKTVDSLITTIIDSTTVTVDTLSRKVTKNYILNSENGFPSDWIRKVIVDNNHVWAATYSSGIIQFNYHTDNDSLVIHNTFNTKRGISDVLIKDIKKDPTGRLWYATQNGNLGYINQGKVTEFPSVLKSQIAIGTLLFNKDQLFVGTAGKGIWYSNLDAPDSFQKLKGEKKLYSENIYQLIFDDQGYLWAGTERGVDKIKLNLDNGIEDLYHFDRNDGFLGIETCLNAVDKDDKGNIWFGTIYGLTKYAPSTDSKAALRPKIYFTDIKEAYKSIDTIVLKNWVKTKKVLQLKPDQTQLSFSYKTIDIDHPNDIEYRYRLNKTDWSPWVKENQQSFAGLAYGKHVFTVQSRNNRWIESDPKTFHFFIDSPLYKKAWFQWTVIALAILSLLGLSLFYIRKIKLKNKTEHERLQMQNHLLSLEQKALRLQMNPHFIFNVLNGIKAMASSKPEKMNNTINSFAVLLRETLYNSRKEHIGLDQEIKTLKHYIEVEQLMAQKSFTYNITINTDPDPEEILIPPMLIQPFVENAIRHGILKGNKDGDLQIKFETSKDYLHCKVIDNGMGIFQSQKAKTKTDHQSMALTVTKERLESISGANAIQISEIKKNNGAIGGTNITFKIPLLTDY